MCPFVSGVEHHPCLMPSQSHCSHTVTLHPSVCPLAVGTVVSSQALSCCGGVPLTGPAAVGDCSSNAALSSAAESIRKLGWGWNIWLLECLGVSLTFWLWLILQTYLISLSLACLNIETETKWLQTFSFHPFFLNKHWKMSQTGTHLHLNTERQDRSLQRSVSIQIISFLWVEIFMHLQCRFPWKLQTGIHTPESASAKFVD